jgi:hypothetical protein
MQVLMECCYIWPMVFNRHSYGVFYFKFNMIDLIKLELFNETTWCLYQKIEITPFVVTFPSWPVLTVIDTGLKLMQDRYHQAMISVTLYADAALIPSTSSRLGSQHHIFMSSFENNPFTICDTNIWLLSITLKSILGYQYLI